MSRTRRVLAAVLLPVLASGACGERGDGSAPPSEQGAGQGSGAAVTPRRVAVQLSDLPQGFKPCPYAGDMDAYIRNIKDLNPDTYQSVMATWAELQGKGATAGYAAYFGDSDRACNNLILPREQRDFGSEEEHIRNHPKMVFSYVIQFRDEATAQAAYEDDIFDHSQLRDQPAFDLSEGPPTRLGRNAIVSASQGSPIETRQAVWQNKTFNVFFGSTALDRQSSETVTAAMNARIR